MQTALQTAPKTSLLATMAARYQMDPEVFKNTIKATVMPAGATNEQMAAFLLVANQYELNPVTKEIYAFPARGGGVTPVVGVDGWINLAQRRPEFDGMEFEYGKDAEGNIESCTCIIYRKDRTRPIIVTEFMEECRRNTDPWKSHPRRLIRHKAVIQAIRYAFGFSGIKDEDEVIAPEHNITPKASVVDLNAKLRESESFEDEAPRETAAAQREDTATAETTTEPEPPEWPKQIDGVWYDQRGVAYNPAFHGFARDAKAPAVTEEGVFRRRRGHDPEALNAYEAEQLADRKSPPQEEQIDEQSAQRQDDAPPVDVETDAALQWAETNCGWSGDLSHLADIADEQMQRAASMRQAAEHSDDPQRHREELEQAEAVRRRGEVLMAYVSANR